MNFSLSIWITALSESFLPAAGKVWKIRLLPTGPQLLIRSLMPILVLLFLTAQLVCAQNESKAITEWRAKVADEARWRSRSSMIEVGKEPRPGAY